MAMENDVSIIGRRVPLSDELASRIRRAISDGKMKSGDRLPTQQELCAMYGVSRPVVREAISRLKSDGLVVSQQGRGHFVNPDGSNVFRLEPDFDDLGDMARMFEFLVSVEASATALAATRRTESELGEIEHWLSKLKDAVAQKKSGVDEDMEFHRAILRATHNSYYITFGDFVEIRVRRLIRAARNNTAQHTGLVEHVQREHEEIFSALQKQDAEAASKSATLHLENATRRLRIYRNA